MKHEFTCSICHKSKVHESELTTGYGTDKNGKKACFECCGWEDKAYMVIEGKNTLYLVKREDGHHVTNWPSTFDIKLNYVRKGRHNIAQTRYDVWFTGPDQMPWHGVQYGENTQILHCKRVKTF